jgi:hypothetical protein
MLISADIHKFYLDDGTFDAIHLLDENNTLIIRVIIPVNEKLEAEVEGAFIFRKVRMLRIDPEVDITVSPNRVRGDIWDVQYMPEFNRDGLEAISWLISLRDLSTHNVVSIEFLAESFEWLPEEYFPLS